MAASLMSAASCPGRATISGRSARSAARSRSSRRRNSARRCALQALAWLNQTLTGGLDEVERALRLTGYVASGPGFDQQPKVIDAASEILVKVFGHAGQHARSAIGVAELPRNAPVEIEFTFALKRRPSPTQRFRRPGFPVVEMR